MDEDLSFHISADALAVIRAMRQTQNSVDQLALQTAKRFGDMQRAGQSLANLFGGLFAGLSVGVVVGKLVSVQREFDVLSSSLTTVTGSSAAAESEMRWIKEFAATTPFALTEVTQAFVKMKALGLDASQQALESYGNTASAMGKNLNQLIEAVADAATGEFERLKEFGIKASTEGNKVSLVFRGVTTTIGKNADEITAYLQQIGNNEFAGAMALRAATLDGAISNLGDTWDELFRTVNQGNAGGLIADSVRLANGVLSDAIALLDALNGVTTEGAAKAGQMGSAQQALGLVLETVAVIFVEISKFVRIASNEIGAFADQVVALATLNFSGAAQIGRTSAAETERILEASARLSEDIVIARQRAAELKAASNAGAGNDAQSRRAAAEAKVAADAERAAKAAAAKAAAAAAEAAKAANKELEEQRKLIAELNGLQPDYIEQLTRIGTLRAKATLSETEYVAAVEALIAKQPSSIKLAKEQAEIDKQRVDTLNALAELERKRADTAEQTVTGLTEQNQALREEIELIGLTERAQLDVLVARNEALALTKEATLAELERASAASGTQTRIEIALAKEISQLRERNQLLNLKFERTEAAEVYTNLQAEGRRFAEQLEQGLTDSLFRAFEAGRGFFATLWDGIKNLFKTTVLKAIIQPVVGGITTSIGLTGAANAGGIDSVFGTASNVASIANLTTSVSSLVSIGSQVASGAMSVANALGTVFANSTGTGISGLLATNGAFGTAAAGSTAATASSALSIAAAAGPYVLAAVAVLNALGVFHSKKIVDGGLQGELGGQINDYALERRGGTLFNGPSYRVLDRGVSAQNDELQKAYNAMRTTVAGMAEQLGIGNDAIKAFTVQLGNDLIHPDTGGFGIKTQGLTQDEIVKKIEAALVSANEQLAAFALGTTEFTRDGETAAQTMARLAGSLQTVNGTFDLLGLTLADASLAGADAASKFVDLFGGVEQFGQVTSSYYANFYTEAERTANTVEALRGQFVALNNSGAFAGTADAFQQFVIDPTRDSFRQLVEAQDVNTEAGRNTIAALLGLSDTFASVVPAIDAAKEAASRQAEQDRLQAAAINSERSDRLRIERETAAAAKAASEELAKLNEQNFRLAISAGNVNAALAARGNTGPRFADFQGSNGFNVAGYNAALLQDQQRSLQQILDELRRQNPFEVSDYFGAINELETTIANFSASLASGEFTGGVSDLEAQAQAAFGDFLSPEQIQAAADGLTAFSNVLSLVNGTAAQGALGADAALRVLQGAYAGSAQQTEEYAHALDIIGQSVGVSTGNLQEIQAAINSGLAYFNSNEYEQSIAQEQLRQQINFTNRAFSALTERAAAFNGQAEDVENSIASIEGFIGRLTSVADAFDNAAGERAVDATLISDAARRFADLVTVPVAQAAQSILSSLPSFENVEAPVLRDITLLLKDLEQFDNEGLEATFIRISDAFASGGVTGEQYADLLNYIEQVYLGTAESITTATDNIANVAQQRLELEERLAIAIGGQEEVLRRQAAAIDESNLALYNQVLAAEEYRTLVDQRTALEQELFEATATQAEILARQREALDESNRSTFDQVQAVQQQIDALRLAEEAERDLAAQRERVSQEREGLERRLLQAQGDTTALRQLELDALDESNRAILRQIFALEDQAAAAEEAARAEQELAAERERIAQERAGLERRILELQGDTQAMRQLELAALDESNRALLLQIFSLEDQAAAAAEAARQQEQAAQARRDADAALRSIFEIGQSLSDQISQIRLQAREQLEQARGGVVNALDTLADASRSAAERLADAQQSAALEMRNAMRSVSDSVGSYLRELAGTSAGSGSILQQRDFNASQFQELAARTLAGDTAAGAKVTEAARAYIDSLRETSGSTLDFAREELRIRAQLAQIQELNSVATDEQTDAVTALQRAEAEALKASQDYAAAVIAAAAAGVEYTETVRTSTSDFNDALASFIEAQRVAQAVQAELAQADADLVSQYEGLTAQLEDFQERTGNLLDGFNGRVDTLGDLLTQYADAVAIINGVQDTLNGGQGSTPSTGTTGTGATVPSGAAPGSGLSPSEQQRQLREYVTQNEAVLRLLNTGIRQDNANRASQGRYGGLGGSLSDEGFEYTLSDGYEAIRGIETLASNLPFFLSGIERLGLEISDLSQSNITQVVADVQLLSSFLNADYEVSPAELALRDQALTRYGIQAFADGGFYPGGMALVGEEGPELINFANPGQVYTADQTRSLMGGDTSRMEAQMERMTNELMILRRELQDIKTNTGDTKTILRRVTQDGDAITTVPA